MTDSTKPNKVSIVGVAGGSGSGKTYFSQHLSRLLGEERCSILSQDNFYIDQSSRFDFDGGSVNFDHPDALDFKLLASCLRELQSGRQASIPVYDFATHKRLPVPLTMKPKRLIIVDGILIFHPPYLRELFEDLIFFDTPEKVRFERRLKRDVEERGRTPQGVTAQFQLQVKPMHDQFVEPTMKSARLVVRTQHDYESALAELVARYSS